MTSKEQTGGGASKGPLMAMVLLGAVAGGLGWVLLTGPGDPSPAGKEPGGAEQTEPGNAAPDTAAVDAFFKRDAIDFAPIEIDPKVISEARARMPGFGAAQPKGTEAIIQAFRALGKAELAGDKKGMRDAVVDFELRMSEFYRISHLAGIEALLTHTYGPFRKSLDKVVKAAAQQSKEPGAFLEQIPEALAEDAALVGGFIRLARSLGLMDDKGQIPARLDPMVEILYRYRMAQGLHGSINPLEIMAPQELRLLNQWRLQEAKGIDARRREGYIRTLNHLWPSYPGILALGVLQTRNGQLQLARQSFQTAAQLDPRQAPLATHYIKLLESSSPKSPQAPAPKDAKTP